ncbi:alanine--tRNA ligase [Algimonas porphyrae]|uniref:Alanine--tRNA ligase n=2 Tax=Algimonas porphyrae TaxID=1128113 RepID=A0ABQ5V1S4_9PROT|nr:alanine--tRNA ligase [Algimonas porphyrae]
MSNMPKLRSIESDEVVEIFTRFFEANDHLKIPGHSLAPDNDPSLLFINSGMAPMKKYFLGQEQPPLPRLCNVQRCIRTNDIEEVGDRHHLTYFEMLGSWSIGDYWKKTAIALAWELLTKGFGYPEDSLYATVYAGNAELGIPGDEDSVQYWKAVGMPDDHIVRLGDDNFWGPAGEFGPCGPCTEVFYDTGDAYGERYVPGGHFDDVNRYIEIWNAGVFMQFNKLPTGMSELDMKSVDTGAGLERMLMALNGYETVYETDLLKPLVDFVVDRVDSLDASSRSTLIVADHIRSVVGIVADGIVPSNSGAGYIPRRLIRRAIAAIHQAGTTDFDFAGMVQLAMDKAGSWNPQVQDNRAKVAEIFAKEQADFESVLEAGVRKLGDEFERLNGKMDGAEAFRFFSTYGLPVDTIRDYFVSRGGAFDGSGFDTAFAEHQEKSRNAKDDGSGGRARLDLSDYPATEFVGYSRLDAKGTIVGLFRDGEPVDQLADGDAGLIILDRTSFYAEGGGQVGDQGTLTCGAVTATVTDVVSPSANVYVHKADLSGGTLSVGDAVDVQVDAHMRRLTQANHSATHLLHAALRDVLGDTVTQAGSLVDSDRLRFDFTYGEKVPDDKLMEIEQRVNAAIRANYGGAIRTMGFDEAISEGALAFFEDKYDDEVRTIAFGDASMELCGGTHVAATGEIGTFVITSEGSVARGIRRIQALTGEAAFDYLRAYMAYAQQAAGRLNVKPEALETRVVELLKSSKKTQAEAPSISVKDLVAKAGSLSDGTPAVIAKIDAGSKQLRPTSVDVAAAINGVAILIAEADGKVHVAVAVAQDRTGDWKAGDILKPLLDHVGGRGGGKPNLAQGGGPDISGLPQLMDAAHAL